MPDRHGTKEIWVERVLYLPCDLELLPWPWIFKVKFWKCCIRNGRADWHGTKGMWVNRILDSHCDFKLWPHPWPWPWIFKDIFLNSCISGMGGPISMERKGYESTGCYTYYVTSSYDFDLGFWRLSFKKLYHRKKRVDWHGTKMMWFDRMLDPSCDFKLWPHPWPWIYKVIFSIAIL